MPSTVQYSGTCDASAAVRVGAASFVSASDEDYILRVYNREAPGAPAVTFDVKDFLKPENPDKEPDIEGAALIGDTIYWVTSHGRNQHREEQESRQRLFATSVSVTDRGIRLEPVGRPYKRLIRDFLGTPELNELDLRRSAQLAPEEPGGLNLEGLAPTRDGRLLIGFRSPVPNGRAIVLALRNPADLIESGAATGMLSIAGRLDLGGRGLRALEYVPEAGTYVVIAGAAGDAHDFGLFTWSGAANDAARPLDIDVGDHKPEELIVTRVSDRTYDLELFSDDGDRNVDGEKCKKAKPQRRSFRGLRTTIEL